MKKSINFQIPRYVCTTAILVVSLFSSTSYADSLMKSGQWQDPKTGLIWMRCSIGQEWNGNTCTGKAIKLTWDDAREYTHKFINGKQRFGGHSNWRLPTIAELATIRYCSKGYGHDTKEVSELTESGRVTRMVDLGVEMETIPSATGSVTVPQRCADGSREPTIDTSIFPATTKKNSFYWSSSYIQGYYNRLRWTALFANKGSLQSENKLRDNLNVRLVRSGQ